MFRKTLSMSSATAFALLLGSVLATVLVSPALARRSARTPTILDSHIGGPRLPHRSHRPGGVGRHSVGLHPGRIGRWPRIIDGSDAMQGDWPFMAFIAYFDAGGNPLFNCTGTVRLHQRQLPPRHRRPMQLDPHSSRR